MRYLFLSAGQFVLDHVDDMSIYSPITSTSQVTQPGPLRTSKAKRLLLQREMDGMIKRKPSQFHLIYGHGVSGEHSDPRTGIAMYRLKWPALKAAMQYLAEKAGEELTLVNSRTGASITVTPEGCWR